MPTDFAHLPLTEAIKQRILDLYRPRSEGVATLPSPTSVFLPGIAGGTVGGAVSTPAGGGAVGGLAGGVSSSPGAIGGLSGGLAGAPDPGGKECSSKWCLPLGHCGCWSDVWLYGAGLSLVIGGALLVFRGGK